MPQLILTPTPPPWTVQELAQGWHGFHDWHTFAVRSSPSNHCLAVVGDVDYATAPHNRANAVLMAAAPNLLRACRMALEWHDRMALGASDALRSRMAETQPFDEREHPH